MIQFLIGSKAVTPTIIDQTRAWMEGSAPELDGMSGIHTPFAGRREACFSGQNLATIGKQTDEYRTRNVEGGRRKSPRKGARRHEKSGSTDFDLASLPSRLPLEFSRFSWLSDPSARALLHSTFLVRYSAVPTVASGVIWLTASTRYVLRG